MTPQSCVETLLRQVHNVVCIAQGFLDLRGVGELQEKGLQLDGFRDDVAKANRQLFRLVIGDSVDEIEVREQVTELLERVQTLSSWSESRGSDLSALREKCHACRTPSPQDHQRYTDAYVEAIHEFTRRRTQVERTSDGIRQLSVRLPGAPPMAVTTESPTATTSELADGVAVQNSRPGQSESKKNKKGMSVQEANTNAMRVSRRLGKVFYKMSQRKQAAAIGCSVGTWKKTTLYLTACKNGQIQPQQARKETSPRAIRFTGKVEAGTGVGGKDSILVDVCDREEQKANSGAELARLQKEQEQDDDAERNQRRRRR